MCYYIKVTKNSEEMGPEGFEPPFAALEAASLPLTYGPINFGILLNSVSSNITILFLPIKNLSFFGFLWQINRPKSQSQSSKYLFNCLTWEIDIGLAL